VLGSVAVEIVCLVLWSWTIGRALRLLSRRAVATNGILLTCVVLTGTIGTTTLSALAVPAMFSSGFARFGAALFVRVVFVLVPMWCGAVTEEKSRWLWASWVRTIASAVAIGITFKWIGAALFLGWVPLRLAQSHPPTVFWWAARFNGWSMVSLLLAPLALAWPAAYLLIHERRTSTNY
jgi:hypothetical protein